MWTKYDVAALEVLFKAQISLKKKADFPNI